MNSTTAHLLDNLTYNYNSTKKNKLEKIGDAATNTAGYSADLDLPNQTNSSNYVYNSIGELIENKQEGLGYEYNSAGLITKVYELSSNNPLTEYTYNDKGLKYSKTSYSSGIFSVETEQLFYVYDAGGAQVATYVKKVILPNTVYQLRDHSLYAAGRAGLLDKSTGKALFELSDHLGNVRAIVADNGSGVAETISYTDYYPHGGVLPGRTYQSSLSFPYGYQGQEKDAATGLTNFELRQYDPRIGRWYNPDPYGQHHSPYLAMSNNPVSFTDPDGGWDGDKAYKNGMAANDEKNKNDFLAQSFASGGNAYNWMAISPTDREMMQKFYGTSYGAQERSRILDVATLGDGYKMNDGGYFSLNNGKVTRTDYTTNSFNYLTGRVHNADGTVSETYSSGSYVSSISKIFGEFNTSEVYGAGKLRAGRWGAGKIMSGTFATTGVLIADDAAVVGVFDDPAIPFVLVGGIIAAGVADIHDNGLDMKSDPTLRGIEAISVFLSGYYHSFAQRGKNNGKLQDDERAAISGRIAGGTATSEDMQKWKRDQKNRGERKSRQSKDKKN